MTAILSSFVTMSCDAEACGKTVTFPQTQEGLLEAIKDNPWLNSTRAVQTLLDKREFNYCSDECEAKGVGSGAHNKQEAKKIIPGVNPQQVELLAKAQERARQAGQALKTGQGVSVTES